MHLETFYIWRKLETGFPQNCSKCSSVHTAAANIHITCFIDFGIMKYGNFQLVFALWNYYTRQNMYTSEGIAVKNYCIKNHEYNNPVLVSFLNGRKQEK